MWMGVVRCSATQWSDYDGGDDDEGGAGAGDVDDDDLYFSCPFQAILLISMFQIL